MKSNKVKPDRVRFQQSTDDYAAVVLSQRTYAREIADRMERGEDFDREFAIAALRAWADNLKPAARGHRGKPPEIDHSDVAQMFEIKRRRGATVEQARAELAEFCAVDESTIDYAVKKCGAAARRWLDFIARCQAQGDNSAH